jgi:hypothetical protein
MLDAMEEISMYQIVDVLQGLRPIIDRVLSDDPRPVGQSDRIRLLDLPLLKALGWNTDDPDAVCTFSKRESGEALTQSPWFEFGAPVIDIFASTSLGGVQTRVAFVFEIDQPWPFFTDPLIPYFQTLCDELILQGFTALVHLQGSFYRIYPLNQDEDVRLFAAIDLLADPEHTALQLTCLQPDVVRSGALMEAARKLQARERFRWTVPFISADGDLQRSIAYASGMSVASALHVLKDASIILDFPPIFPLQPLPEPDPSEAMDRFLSSVSGFPSFTPDPPHDDDIGAEPSRPADLGQARLSPIMNDGLSSLPEAPQLPDADGDDLDCPLDQESDEEAMAALAASSSLSDGELLAPVETLESGLQATQSLTEPAPPQDNGSDELPAHRRRFFT